MDFQEILLFKPICLYQDKKIILGNNLPQASVFIGEDPEIPRDRNLNLIYSYTGVRIETIMEVETPEREIRTGNFLTRSVLKGIF